MSHLTLEQRYTIEVLRKENYSQTEIAKRLNRNKSVIFNELKRNSDQRNGLYKAELAHKKVLKRHREKNKIIYFTDEVKQYVEPAEKVIFKSQYKLVSDSFDHIFF